MNGYIYSRLKCSIYRLIVHGVHASSVCLVGDSTGIITQDLTYIFFSAKRVYYLLFIVSGKIVYSENQLCFCSRVKPVWLLLELALAALLKDLRYYKL